ncbi:MAG: type II toxin-antitoxin system VapC family toxin [Candidatus Sulfotelmatobacter sp.]
MILLDTHVLVWMASDPKRLSAKARDAIRTARQEKPRENTGVAIATITLWELAWLAHSGRLQVLSSVESFVRETVARVALKPMTPEITAMAVRLPAAYPKDPADRVIASTAIVEGIPLVTADQQIRRSNLVTTIW